MRWVSGVCDRHFGALTFLRQPSPRELLEAEQALFTLIACLPDLSTSLAGSWAARSASDDEVAYRDKREVHVMAWNVQLLVPDLERKEHM